jgi:hypothetical protein
LMRKREAEAATTRTGRMGAEDPVGVPGRTSFLLLAVAIDDAPARQVVR